MADALTYPGMKALALASRLDLLSLPAAGEGMNLDALEVICNERPVRAVYAMPTMHNPLGWVMPERDRMQLAALSERFGFFDYRRWRVCISCRTGAEGTCSLTLRSAPFMYPGFQKASLPACALVSWRRLRS